MRFTTYRLGSFTGSIERVINFIKIRKTSITEDQVNQIEKALESIVKASYRLHDKELVGAETNFENFFNDIGEVIASLIDKPKEEVIFSMNLHVKIEEGSEEIIQSLISLLKKEIISYIESLLS